MREQEVVQSHVGHSCQSRKRHEAVAAAVAVESDERVAADHLELQEAVVDGIHIEEIKVAEQVQQIDLVLARLESGDRLVGRIEGNRGGTLRGIDFPMRRVSCEKMAR